MKESFLLMFSMVLIVCVLAACGTTQSAQKTDSEHVTHATAKDNHESLGNEQRDSKIGKESLKIESHSDQKNSMGKVELPEADPATKKSLEEQNKGNHHEPETIVITSDILKEINKHFNSDLPFKQKEKYVIKRVGHDPSWGARYENGITIDDKGVMTAWKGDYVKSQLMPFQVRPYLRTILGGSTMAVLVDNDKLIENGMLSGQTVNLEKIKTAKHIYSSSGIDKPLLKKMKKFAEERIQYIRWRLTTSAHIDKFPKLKHYMKKSIPLLEKATHGDYMAYLNAVKRDILLSAILSPRMLEKHVQFK